MKMSSAERAKMMLTAPVSRIIPKLAIPTIISMLITSIYNMADTYFVSQISTAASGASGASGFASIRENTRSAAAKAL